MIDFEYYLTLGLICCNSCCKPDVFPFKVNAKYKFEANVLKHKKNNLLICIIFNLKKYI